MIKAVFVTPIPEEYQSMFTQYKDVDFTFIPRTKVRFDDIRDAEIILGNLPEKLVNRCEKLKWLQLDSAGANLYKNLNESVILTNASGAYGTAISEHMLACVLMVMKKLAEYLEIQKERSFTNLGSVNTITSSKVLCVGMGDIGTHFAEKMNALGAEVYGVRRSIHDKPDFVKELYTSETMDEILPECDIVALSLPETSETVSLFNAERLRKMKKGSILVNVGRGTAIDTMALYEVMQEGHLGAACLDVTDPEPLPKNHPLWNTKNIYITPHISGRFNAHVTFDLVLKIFRENLTHYLNQEPLEHIVNRHIGY